MDNKYFMHFRNQIHQPHADETATNAPAAAPSAYDSQNLNDAAHNYPADAMFDDHITDRQSAGADVPFMELGQLIANNDNFAPHINEHNKNSSRTTGSASGRSNTSRSCGVEHLGVGAEGYTRDRNLASSTQFNRPNSK